jgi:hypothetical protein
MAIDETALTLTAATLVAGDKGLIAMDESNPTCNKRFALLGIPQTPEVRRTYRELIVTTPGLGAAISGAILYDETIRQRLANGRSFPEALLAAGIVPGIKVDHGESPLASFPAEQITEGLDEKSVGALTDYYRTVELGLSVCLHEEEPPVRGRAREEGVNARSVAAVVFGSDQGLVGPFNELVVDAATKGLAGPRSACPRSSATGPRRCARSSAHTCSCRCSGRAPSPWRARMRAGSRPCNGRTRTSRISSRHSRARFISCARRASTRSCST